MVSAEMRCMDMEGAPTKTRIADNVLFKAGSTHTFTFVHADLGDISTCKVVYNNPAKGSWIPVPGWDLSSITLTVQAREFEFIQTGNGRLNGTMTLDCSRYLTKLK